MQGEGEKMIMTRRKDGLLTGCVHNKDRVVKLPEQRLDPRTGQLNFMAGQFGVLVCEVKGCEVPVIYMSIGRENKAP